MLLDHIYSTDLWDIDFDRFTYTLYIKSLQYSSNDYYLGDVISVVGNWVTRSIERNLKFSVIFDLSICPTKNTYYLFQTLVDMIYSNAGVNKCLQNIIVVTDEQIVIPEDVHYKLDKSIRLFNCSNDAFSFVNKLNKERKSNILFETNGSMMTLIEC